MKTALTSLQGKRVCDMLAAARGHLLQAQASPELIAGLDDLAVQVAAELAEDKAARDTEIGILAETLPVPGALRYAETLLRQRYGSTALAGIWGPVADELRDTAAQLDDWPDPVPPEACPGIAWAVIRHLHGRA